MGSAWTRAPDLGVCRTVRRREAGWACAMRQAPPDQQHRQLRPDLHLSGPSGLLRLLSSRGPVTSAVLDGHLPSPIMHHACLASCDRLRPASAPPPVPAIAPHALRGVDRAGRSGVSSNVSCSLRGGQTASLIGAAVTNRTRSSSVDVNDAASAACHAADGHANLSAFLPGRVTRPRMRRFRCSPSRALDAHRHPLDTLPSRHTQRSITLCCACSLLPWPGQPVNSEQKARIRRRKIFRNSAGYRKTPSFRRHSWATAGICRRRWWWRRRAGRGQEGGETECMFRLSTAGPDKVHAQDSRSAC